MGAGSLPGLLAAWGEWILLHLLLAGILVLTAWLPVVLGGPSL